MSGPVDVLAVMDKAKCVLAAKGADLLADRLATAADAVAVMIEATSPLASLTVLRADGTIRDDELVLISGERINAIRAALARCRGEA